MIHSLSKALRFVGTLSHFFSNSIRRNQYFSNPREQLRAALAAFFLLSATSVAFAGTADLSWDANTESDLSGYKVYFGTSSGSYGTPTSVENTTSHTLSGLSVGTYFFAVTAIDTSGNESGFSTEVSKTITSVDTNPPVISGINAGSPSASGATISWTTDESSDTQVEYGTTTAYGSMTTLSTSMVTSHSQSLSGLSAGTTYHYRVLSRDASGNLGTSGDNTFTTGAGSDTTPPSLSGISSSNVTTTSGKIVWTSDEASDTQVEYGTSTSYGSTTTLDSSLVTAHSQTLSGLSPSTIIHYRVLSRDPAGNLATSGDGTFTTLTVSDTTSPIISGIVASSVTEVGAIITWSTDEGATSQVEYGTTTAYGSSSAMNTGTVTSHSRALSGLSTSTTYHYRVVSQDTAGNTAMSGDNSFTTITASGSPSEITSLSVDSGLPYEAVEDGLSNGVLVYIDRSFTYDGVPSFLSGATFIKTANDDKSSTGSSFLTFDINQDSTIYIAHDDRITVKPTWMSTFSDTGQELVINGDPFSLWKKDFPAGSVVLGGNEGSGKSMYTVLVVEKGTGSSDTTPPSLSSIAAGSITANTAVISWSTDEAATSQVEYGSTATYGSLSSVNTTLVTSHGRTLTGLSASKTYHYRVISSDAVGNTVTGSDSTFTTLAATDTTGPSISSIVADNISQSNATITWTTDEPATSQIEYGPTTAYGTSTTQNATLLLSHTQTLAGLSLGTVVHFRVLSIDADGNLSASGDQSFKTADAVDTTAPMDISNFTAVGSDGKVSLSWTNPADLDFVGVRIMYRTDGFPTGINNGTLLGDISGGPDQEMTITHTGLSNGVTYFYLAAAYDDSGNFQTTVFVSAIPKGPAAVEVSGDGSVSGGGGGCGMIRPGGGEPPSPGDAAAMLTTIGLIFLLLLKKISKSIPGTLFARTRVIRI